MYQLIVPTSYEVIPRLTYDGSQLRSRFLRETFLYSRASLEGLDIGWFVGPAHVTPDGHMVDREDIEKNAPIHSDAMVHFIFEEFVGSQMQVPDLFRAVCLQRLLVRIIADKLQWYRKINYRVSGDDVFLQEPSGAVDSKLSVSIATNSPISILCHTALNMTTEGTPPGIKVASLWPFDIVPRFGPVLEGNLWSLYGFANDICQRFANEYESILFATGKVNSVP